MQASALGGKKTIGGLLSQMLGVDLKVWGKGAPGLGGRRGGEVKADRGCPSNCGGSKTRKGIFFIFSFSKFPRGKKLTENAEKGPVLQKRLACTKV